MQAIIIRRAGTTIFRMAFRVCREFPPEMGAESMLESLPTTSGIGAKLVGMLQRLADAATYDGMLAAEFLETATDRLCVIDINPRQWGSLAFSELLGLRVTERAVRDVLRSNPLPMPEEVSNRRYHHLLRELRWLRARPRSVGSILATTSTLDVWDVPSLSDPLPDLLWLTRRLTRAWPGTCGRPRSPLG